MSLPGSPFTPRRASRASQFSWRKSRPGRATDRTPLVYSYLETINLPYADDSNAVTPTSEELCNVPHKKDIFNGRRGSFVSHQSRRSHPDGPKSPSRRSSFASQISRTSRNSRFSFHSPGEHYRPKESKESKLESLWNKSKGTHLLPEVIVDKTKSDDNVSVQCVFCCTSESQPESGCVINFSCSYHACLYWWRHLCVFTPAQLWFFVLHNILTLLCFSFIERSILPSDARQSTTACY